jgi:hypothetical protein
MQRLAHGSAEMKISSKISSGINQYHQPTKIGYWRGAANGWYLSIAFNENVAKIFVMKLKKAA